MVSSRQRFLVGVGLVVLGGLVLLGTAWFWAADLPVLVVATLLMAAGALVAGLSRRGRPV